MVDLAKPKQVGVVGNGQTGGIRDRPAPTFKVLCLKKRQSSGFRDKMARN